MMATNSNMKAMPMEEDDDIELLRIAALKSLHNKPKEHERSVPIGHFAPSRPLDHLVQGFQFHQRMPSQMYRHIPPSGYHNPPYVQQTQLHPMHASFLPATNVQLSPRSMAFVAQNNDIIMRRNRSPSPRRWSSSRSTSPRSPTRYRSRSPEHKRTKFTPPRKSRSRSPAHNNNMAPIRRRSPKSPVGQRNSPKYNQRNPRFNRNRAENTGANNDAKRFNNQQGDYKRRRNGNGKPRDAWANKQDDKTKDKAEKIVKTDKSEKVADRIDKIEELISSSSSKDVRAEGKSEEPVVETKTTINKKITKSTAESSTGVKREKTQEEIEDELLASSNDESDLDMDTIEDGLDLFASEESESENEGRFKLSSSNNKKSVPAPSFSKLGKSSDIKELRELEPTSSRYGSGNDRNRHHSGKRDFDHRRKDSNSKYSETRRRTPPMPIKATKELSKDAEKKKEDKEKIMFKATFKTVESTVNIVKKEEEKPKPVKDEKRVILIRRPKLPAKEEEQPVPVAPKLEELKTSKPSNITSTKKSIHSRLGAFVTTKKEIGIDKKSAIEKIKKLILKNIEQNAFMRIKRSKKLLKMKSRNVVKIHRD